MDFQKNNLHMAVSPYLQQHKDNPVFWQEWCNEVLEYARLSKKPILVSVGYATCHWCHVMAKEAFSDSKVADFLNKNFISIKVDKEQRPDIDNYMMSYIQQTTGQGGWPLNVFLTPEIKPFYAGTYFPVESKFGLLPFLDLLNMLVESYDENDYQDFIPVNPKSKDYAELEVIKQIMNNLDTGVPKFPPYSTILFLLHVYELNNNNNKNNNNNNNNNSSSNKSNTDIRNAIEKLLDNISQKGLQDHLQGGFYRYCVDDWKIPHFEKMLYDQAMHLWTFSIAYKIYNKEEYRKVAVKIIKCLDETFSHDGLYYSSHDADTNHSEGLTYLWSSKELDKVLTDEEYLNFERHYSLSPNFENKIHLQRIKSSDIDQIEHKLLNIRKLRGQPFVDRKIITSWNCLAGIGLVQAYRNIGDKIYLEKAEKILINILKLHYNNKLFHSSLDGEVQDKDFLEDYSSMLLLLTYLHEDFSFDNPSLNSPNLNYAMLIKEFYDHVLTYKKAIWIENKPDDFVELQANEFDHPIPSSVSIAEMALMRANVIMDKETSELKFKNPVNCDFHNLAVIMSTKINHITAINKIEWNKLPLNCMQVKGGKYKNCYKAVCNEFKNDDDLITEIWKK